MGPFKHEVDDGLDCRKAAYECLYTLLDGCLDHLNILEFMEHVIRGLSDHYDIKTLCFLFLRRLVHAAPNAVAQRLEPFTVEITKVLQSKVKPNAVKQEAEKTDELKRSALRAVHALTLLPDAGKQLRTGWLSTASIGPQLVGQHFRRWTKFNGGLGGGNTAGLWDFARYLHGVCLKHFAPLQTGGDWGEEGERFQ